MPGSDPCHIINRKVRKIKWVLENGFIGCRDCHILFDNNRTFREKVIEVMIGKELYNKLKDIKNGKATTEDYGFTKID